MKRAIAEYLEREERYEQDKQENLRRWQRYQESGAFISHADMRERLDVLAGQARERGDSSV